MKNNSFKVIFSFALFIMVTSVYGQSNSYWTQISKQKANSGKLHFRKTEPIKANYYNLNLNELKNVLANAPKREVVGNNSNLIVDFPNSKGEIEKFKIVEASVMESELEMKYPNFKSYAGQGLNNPESLIRFSITNKGLHVMGYSNLGTEYIDPYSKNSNSYIVYNKRALPLLNGAPLCHYENTDEDNNRILQENERFFNANDGTLRNFRIAIATTIEYSQFHWMAAGIAAGATEAVKRTAVADAIVVTLTRNNMIYERDLSLTMTLVGNNNSIIFIDSDMFDNNNAGTLINQSQTVIDGAIGDSNYDVGHTFSTGGGGLAALGSPCITGNKARGITGLAQPVGDSYDVDFVAHELGHQFGSPHTFNGSAANCAGGNRSSSNAYEVGSGSTIMAYAGICPPQNVQSNSDAYFHQRSLLLIFRNISSQNSTCASTTGTNNTVPTSEAGASFTVPISTPYKLTGSSTDADGTASHTYTWEQYDLGAAGIPMATNTAGPMVRSVQGTTNPTRFIPGLGDLLTSNGGSTQWEVLPSVARDQNFRLTVRDNDVRGGQTAVDNMTVSFNASAGPFLVTSQNTNQIVWTAGNTETITWNVANTDTGLASSANVNILLSTDGGVTYPTVLASNVPNDGSHDITVPNVSAGKCRIMVEAATNIFFNINSKFIAIGNYVYVPGPETCKNYPFNAGIPVPENATGFTGYPLTIADSGTISDVNLSVNLTHSNSGDIFIGLRSPAETTGEHRMISAACIGPQDLIVTFDDEGSAINCASTNTNDNVTPAQPLSFADGQDSQGDWVFFITDVTVNDRRIATLNNLTLTICTTEAVPVLATESFSLEDSLSLYPNPSKGQFTLDLKTLNSNSVSVSVSDIRGRRIFNENYKANGSLKETIDLGRVQSGIYLVNIKDGNNQVTKKVVVE